jgi:hypothetical protein
MSREGCRQTIRSPPSIGSAGASERARSQPFSQRLTRSHIRPTSPHRHGSLATRPVYCHHVLDDGSRTRTASDVGTLRLADQVYSLGHHGHFAYFTKSDLPWKSKLNVRVQAEDPTFLEDAASGELPAVSWIDPSFGNFNPLGLRQNDDHPPADVRDGQDLVLAVYSALAAGPLWEKTLLVIFYDEHGGFFDHVPPPETLDDDPNMFGRYGVRVPAIVVSPWVDASTASKTQFDHTSIMKTVLLRFCADDLERGDRRQRLSAWLKAGHPHYMGKRVACANDLGELLTREEPRAAPSHDKLIGDAASRASAIDRGPADRQESDEAPTDVQKRLTAAGSLLRNRGHPPNRP